MTAREGVLSADNYLRAHGTDLREQESFVGKTRIGGLPPKPPRGGGVPPPQPPHPRGGWVVDFYNYLKKKKKK